MTLVPAHLSEPHRISSLPGQREVRHYVDEMTRSGHTHVRCDHKNQIRAIIAGCYESSATGSRLNKIHADNVVCKLMEISLAEITPLAVVPLLYRHKLITCIAGGSDICKDSVVPALQRGMIEQYCDRGTAWHSPYLIMFYGVALVHKLENQRVEKPLPHSNITLFGCRYDSMTS